MNRKRIGFARTAALVAACGLAAGLSRASDQEGKRKSERTPLGKLMEQVQKRNAALTRLTRNDKVFEKSQKEVERAAIDLVRLAKESKPFKDGYLKNAKNESQPEKKWDEIMGAFVRTSQDLALASAKANASQKEVKDLFQSVKKTCSDCHTVFRVEEEL